MRIAEDFFCKSCRAFYLYDSQNSTMVCPQCQKRAPVVNGIPRFVSPDNYSKSFGFQWNKYSRTQLDSYTGHPISANRVFNDSRWPKDLSGQRILEAGSGAGRFTEVLLGTGATVYSTDFSTAVEANYRNNAPHPNLNLFQGDLRDIPLKPESFDKVMCIGVLQHTPEPERSFDALVSFVKPGGQIFIDVYRKDLLGLLQWKYFLRPLTKRLNQQLLYSLLKVVVPALIPVTSWLGRIAGRAGRRLSPIVEYSHLGLPPQINREWAILDTFDMYSPQHDHPKTLAEIRGWLERNDFIDIKVRKGSNGVVATGKKRS